MDALEYHERTKHTPESVRGGAGLDWPNRPRLFKRYVGLDAVPIPETLGPILAVTGGITKLMNGMPFRAAACTGALYHVEMYVIAEDAVAHAAMDRFQLVPLREGDHRGVVPTDGRLTVAFTTVFWRNAWKYRERMYRHAFWDLGTMLANALAACEELGVPAEVVLGFADDEVDRLLGVESHREVATALLALGSSAPVPEPPAIAPLDVEVEPYSRTEIDYPVIRETHAASSLPDADAAARWRAAMPGPRPAPAVEPPWRDRLVEVVKRRGSTRDFTHDAIALDELHTTLASAVQPIRGDVPPVAELFVIANAVEGLDPGAYAYDRESGALSVVEVGDLRHDAGLLALGQALGADAAANVYSLTRLEPVIGLLGHRGYRAAQLEGGIMGGRMYLAAYAQDFGATGLTFFDDLVTGFFGPRAAGSAVMFLTALGHRNRR